MVDIDSLSFLADYVKQNRPLVIKNAISNWPALEKWKSNEYLVETMGDSEVSVASSPFGKVDAVYHNRYFVEPLVTQMKLSDFFAKLREDDNRDEVLYIQQQNGNFDLEFSALKQDIDPSSLDSLSRAFRTEVDAANIWIGTEESVSSAHKDHYENLYAQICGRKIFYVLPPAAVTHLDIQLYESAQFTRDENNEWKIEPRNKEEEEEEEADMSMKVPWVKMDLRQAYDFNMEHLYVMKVVLEPGDVLNLPSLWYHQVEQQNDESGRVIAVNFWFDMTYDQNYQYYQLLENLACEWKAEIVAMENGDESLETEEFDEDEQAQEEQVEN